MQFLLANLKHEEPIYKMKPTKLSLLRILPMPYLLSLKNPLRYRTLLHTNLAPPSSSLSYLKTLKTQPPRPFYIIGHFMPLGM